MAWRAPPAGPGEGALRAGDDLPAVELVVVVADVHLVAEEAVVGLDAAQEWRQVVFSTPIAAH